MTGPASPRSCRLCQAPLESRLLDLGLQPDPDDLRLPGGPGVADPAGPFDPAGDGGPAVRRIDAWICSRCGLVQLGAPDEEPNAVRDAAADRPVHGHGSIHSSTLTAAASAWLDELLRLPVDRPLVVDVAADGTEVLDAARAAGRPAVGLAPSWAADAAAGDDAAPGGRETEPFGRRVAGRLLEAHGPAGLIVARHVLAHRDALGDVLDGLAALRSPDGVVAIELHHAAALADGQFDVISAAHRTYLSLLALEPALHDRGLATQHVERTDLNGGTLRLLVRGVGTPPDPTVADLLAAERAAALDRPAGYATLADTAARVCADLRDWLDEAAAAGRRVAGYGAPARGVVLLNAAGIGPDRLPWTVDRSPAKQGRLLPGSRIPVRPPEALDADPPDDVLILAWTLRDEIAAQLAHLRRQGTRLYVAMPRLELVA